MPDENGTVFSVFTGTPIEVSVEAPAQVEPGEEFGYTVKVRDIDQAGPLNPRGIDPNTAVFFQITSMSGFRFQIAPNPDTEGFMVCEIVGVAKTAPGIYVDGFRGYNRLPGIITSDPPTDVLHRVKIKQPTPE